jgi:branched-chain amino acid transport system ATP-binding protein
MLEVENLFLDYDGAHALAGVTLEVRTGEVVALVGSNGAGKSSLLKAISGLHRPVHGSVRFDGAQISELAAHRVSRLGIRLVPEGRRLFSQLSVRRNLMLGAYTERDPGTRERDFTTVIELFPVLAERMQQAAGTLSGGEQQMLALGRALMGRPRLLMLDEPSLGVAPKPVAEIFDALVRIRDQGTTVLIVEQDIRRALAFADRAYVLQTGRIVASGPASELMRSDELRRAYLGI